MHMYLVWKHYINVTEQHTIILLNINVHERIFKTSRCGNLMALANFFSLFIALFSSWTVSAFEQFFN